MCFCSFITSRGPLVTPKMFKAFIVLVGNLLWDTRWPFISAYTFNVHQNQSYRQAVLYFYSIYTSWVSIDQLVHMYLKGFGPPIIKGTGLYKLILVWRGFIMTVHIVVWVITLMISLCCSIYHEILLFLK